MYTYSESLISDPGSLATWRPVKVNSFEHNQRLARRCHNIIGHCDEAKLSE